jgi:hypothetical protein
MTDSESLPLFATYSFEPSADIARPWGVDPAASVTVSVTVLSDVRMTDTESPP